jgi:hypothetical protein
LFNWCECGEKFNERVCSTERKCFCIATECSCTVKGRDFGQAVFSSKKKSDLKASSSTMFTVS